MNETAPPLEADRRAADVLALLFAALVVLHAASGPLDEFVRWAIERLTDGFDELSRRDQRALLRSHWLGAAHGAPERWFLQPTGLIIGLPIVLSFAISLLTLHRARWLNLALAALTVAVFAQWILKISASDAGALPATGGLDGLAFPVGTALLHGTSEG